MSRVPGNPASKSTWQRTRSSSATRCKFYKLMERLKPVDVVIVGGGWTGLLMAKEIATQTSLSVVLERGAARRTSDYTEDMDEVVYVLRFRMLQNIADEIITHRYSWDAVAAPIRQHGGFHPGAGLGGAGEHWTASTFRFMPDVFHITTHYLDNAVQ